jgi:hypothetical protein
MLERGVVLEGDLSAIGFPDVLTFFSMVRKTGRLTLRQIEIEKAIYWQEGEIVFASSNIPDEQLPRFLLRNGKISPAQYDDLQGRLSGDTRAGKALVQMGAITPKDLWWGVKNQVLEIIYGMFGWRQGYFAFTETATETSGERITLSMSTTSIIMEGIRRLDEWARIQEKIPTPQVIFARVPGMEREVLELELPETETRVLEAVDGERPLHEVNRIVGLTEFETSRILFSLLSARVIQKVGLEKVRAPVFLDVEDEPELLKVTAVYNRMFGKLHEALAAKVGEDTAGRIFGKLLNGSEGNELLAGLAFDEVGRFDENLLIANVSDLPVEERRRVLDEGLNTLLSYQLFEVTQYLDPDVKKAVYRMISDMKGELE